MRKRILAGIGLVFMGLAVATPAAAKDWRACVVGACLKPSCGDNDASVLVLMATNVDDPAVGGTSGALDALLKNLLRRNQGMTGDPIMNCAGPYADGDSAEKMSENIVAQMKLTFFDVTLVSPNDVFLGYDTPQSE